jgi:protein-ribulosamine 3-kinase
VIPEAVSRAVQSALGDRLTDVRPVSGGNINEAVSGRLGGELVFLKYNRDGPAGMFEAEAAGLAALRSSKTLRVPRTLAWSDDPGFLALEHIAPSRGRGEGVGEQLGRGLAQLHRSGTGAFGFETDNFIGSLPQRNCADDSWVAFFTNARLRPQLEHAARTGALGEAQVRAVESLLERLPQLLPDRPAPALLHGDLWGGNYLVGPAGEPVLIDPAVYRGHREVELAFTELFGGFDRAFYAAYEATWPLDPGYGERRDLYNTYPLLVHVNLFGGGYRGQLMSAVRRYS